MNILKTRTGYALPNAIKSSQAKMGMSSGAVLLGTMALLAGCTLQSTNSSELGKKFGPDVQERFERQQDVKKNLLSKGGYQKMTSGVRVFLPEKMKPFSMDSIFSVMRDKCREIKEVETDSRTESSANLGVSYKVNLMLTSDDTDYRTYKVFNPSTVFAVVPDSGILKEAGVPADSSAFYLDMDCYGKVDHTRVDTVKDTGPDVGINMSEGVTFGIGF